MNASSGVIAGTGTKGNSVIIPLETEVDLMSVVVLCNVPAVNKA
jgi:hypothetical protein